MLVSTVNGSTSGRSRSLLGPTTAGASMITSTIGHTQNMAIVSYTSNVVHLKNVLVVVEASRDTGLDPLLCACLAEDLP